MNYILKTKENGRIVYYRIQGNERYKLSTKALIEWVKLGLPIKEEKQDESNNK